MFYMLSCQLNNQYYNSETEFNTNSNMIRFMASKNCERYHMKLYCRPNSTSLSASQLTVNDSIEGHVQNMFALGRTFDVKYATIISNM
jgi:hypothetical protein